MATVEKNHGTHAVSSSPVTIYENLNFANHEGYLFFDVLAAADEFNYTVEVIDIEAAAYRVVTSKNIDYAKSQNFTEKGIHIYPRTTDQIRIKVTKVSGADRTVTHTMYAILIT